MCVLNDLSLYLNNKSNSFVHASSYVTESIIINSNQLTATERKIYSRNSDLVNKVESTVINTILDSGATHTLITETQSAHHPINDSIRMRIKFGNGTTTVSLGFMHISLTSDIKLVAHVVKDSDLQCALMSVHDLCNQNLKVEMDKSVVRIIDENNVQVANGLFDPETRAWHMKAFNDLPVEDGSANYVINNQVDAENVAFYHAAFGSPTVSSMILAMRKGFLDTVYGLTLQQVLRNPPVTITTEMGHMVRQRQGLRSTQVLDKPLVLEPIVDEPVDALDNCVSFKVMATFNALGTSHSDLTGEFPYPSRQNSKYILVSYFNGYIHVIPMASKSSISYTHAFKQLYDFYAEAGHVPTYQRLDNELSLEVKELFKKVLHVELQTVPPDNHRTNRAERAIGTFKPHMISTLATCDPSCPFNLWEDFLPQMELTINVLRPSPVNPNISCYQQLWGIPFDFGRHPIAPCGTKVAIYEGPDKRSSWAAHALAGYYVGPLFTGYRTFRVFVNATQHIRTSDSLAWFSPYNIPGSSTVELLLGTIHEFTNALNQITGHHQVPIDNRAHELKSQIGKDLQELAKLYLKVPQMDTPVYPMEPVALPIPDIVAGVPKLKVHFEEPLHPDVTVPTIPTISIPLIIPSCVPPQRVESPVPSVVVIHPPVTSPVQRVAKPRRTPRERIMTRHMSKGDAPLLPSTTVNRYRVAANSLTLISDILPDISSFTTNMRYVDPANPRWGDCMKRADKQEWLDENDRELRRLITVSSTMYPINHSDMPAGHKAAYYNPQCTEKIKPQGLLKRVRGTIGGDQIAYSGDVAAHTASLPDLKCLLNAVVSTPGGMFMTIDIVDYYLQTPLETPEYMKIHRKFISPAIEKEFKLSELWFQDHIYFKVVKGIYGLPQAGILAQKQLFPRLCAGGFIASMDNPCLFKHVTLPIQFVLTVDDFGVKYQHVDDVNHLLNTLSMYQLKVDWSGRKYLGMKINHQVDKGILELSMPGYVGKALMRFQVPVPKKAVDTPAYCPPVSYGKEQLVDKEDTSTPLGPAEIHRIQQIIGVFLYYARCVDITAFTILNKMSKQLAKPTQVLMQKIDHFLAYMASNPDATLVFKASDMQLCVHSDASYLSEPESRSRAGGFHWIGSDLPYNGAVDILSTTIKAVVSAASEAEYGAAFLNATQALPTMRTLNFLGFQQFPVTVTMDNSVACGVVNNTVKSRRSKAMDMRFHWLKDREAQKQFKFIWDKGSNNLADYFTKILPSKEYKARRHIYVDN